MQIYTSIGLIILYFSSLILNQFAYKKPSYIKMATLPDVKLILNYHDRFFRRQRLIVEFHATLL